MRNINNIFKEDIRTYGRQLDYRIKVNDALIDTDNFNSIKPSFNANLFKTIMHAVKINSKNKLNSKDKINIQPGLKVNQSNYNYINYNSYYVNICEREEDTLSYNILAYDKMIESMIDYDLELSEKIPLKLYLIIICQRLGWNTKNIPATFINSEKLMDPTLHIGIGYTFRDVLDEIATLSCSALLFKNDEFYLKYPEETGEEIDETYLDEDSITIGEKYFINSLVFSRAEESDNIFRKDDDSIEENGLHEYKISDNQLLSTNDRDLYIDEMWNYLKTFEFYTYDIQSKGILFLEAYDKFNFVLSGQVYSTILLNDETTFEDGLTENMYLDAPEETQTDYKCADSTDKKINKAYILVDKQNQKIESLTSEVGQYSERISTVEQTVNGITQKVESIEEFSREVSSMQQLHLSDTAEGENLILNLTIYGDTNKFKVLTPSATLVPSKTLVPYGGSVRIVVDTQPRNNPSANAKIYKIKIGEPLRNVGNIRDELRIVNNKISIVRRISNTLQVLANETVEELGQIVIPTFKDNTYIYIREYPTLEYFCRYIIDNDYLDTFATQQELKEATVELNTLIEQTNSSITLLASKKVGKDEIISSINMSPEKIKILANKIGISANDVLDILAGNTINLTSKNLTISSKSLNIDKDGNMIFYAPGLNVLRVLNPNNNRKSIYINDQFIVVNTDGKEDAVDIGIIDDKEGAINLSGNGYTTLKASGINTPILTQTSLEEQKKNFEKLQDNALEIIKNIDIYKYNLKNEKDTDKKHIGFVIGDYYNYSEEVTSIDNKGVDNYSFTSLCCKAIQEQQKEIEQLKQKIEQMSKNNLQNMSKNDTILPIKTKEDTIINKEESTKVGE